MSLSITVGLPSTSDAEQMSRELQTLSAALKIEGIEWQEPSHSRVVYSELLGDRAVNALKRVAALVLDARQVTPMAREGLAPADMYLITDEASLLRSHLICHSGSEGFIIPVANAPLFLDPEWGVAGGGVVSSTEGLRAELLRYAPAIDIVVDEDFVERPEDIMLTPRSDPYYAERVAWARLYAACESSARTGCAMIFS